MFQMGTLNWARYLLLHHTTSLGSTFVRLPQRAMIPQAQPLGNHVWIMQQPPLQNFKAGSRAVSTPKHIANSLIKNLSSLQLT